MATAIVADGAREHLGHGPLAIALALVGALLYLVTLVAVLGGRAAPSTPTALSFVAGSGALAAVAPGVLAVLLTIAAGAGWVAIAVGGRLRRPPSATGTLPGGALLATVATQAVVVAGATELARRHGDARELLLWGGSALCLLGVVLYGVFVPAVVRGLLARRGERPAGDDWIAMGALAISALAACTLSEAMRRLGAPQEIAMLAADLGAACWLGASVWLAPLLWRERRWLLGHAPRTYGFDRWATVFPLGMYSASAAAVARGLDRRAPLHTISSCALALALGAWLATTVGGLRTTLARRR